MSNNAPVIRRKWAFEKGRNSRSVLLAFIVTLAVFFLLAAMLQYGVSTPDNRRQNTAFSFIRQDERKALQLIREFDPADTYRINSGGYPFCLNCRRSHDSFCEYSDNFIEAVKKFPGDQAAPDHAALRHKIAAAAPEAYTFPLSGSFAPVIPHADKVLPVLTVTDETGQAVASGRDKLEEINRQLARPAVTAVRISGSGLLASVQVISSCGSRKYDLQAGNILKLHRVKPGIYTIYWSGRRGTI